MMGYTRVYGLLKATGHSPEKALEILIDARRGKRYALDWVRVCFNQRKPREY